MTDDRRDNAAAALGYMPQLDGLRAIAVSAVVFQHYGISSRGAAFGVHLFFVLSGFLITGILLKGRERAVTEGIKPEHVFRQFYARRALRIFPLYYLVVLIGVVVNAHYARAYAPWLLTYTINLKMAAQGWYIANFGHFWSLAVEEQYYLFWPWLVLLLPRRWLLPAAITMTATGPLFRLGAVASWALGLGDPLPLTAYIPTPATLDSLGMGSLIAILLTSEEGRDKVRRWIRAPAALVGLGLALALPHFDSARSGVVLADTGAAVFFGWLIYRASSGFGGIPGRVLGSAPFRYFGRISYGIYVYHPLVRNSLISIAAQTGMALPQRHPTAVFVALTVIVATISWYALERPINDLKRYFPYVPRVA